MCNCSCCLTSQIKKLRKELRNAMSQFSATLTSAIAQLTKANSAIKNVAGDVKNLAQQVKDLKDQIANGGSVLTTEDQAAFDAFVGNLTTAANDAQVVADQTPDLPNPPPPPGQ